MSFIFSCTNFLKRGLGIFTSLITGLLSLINSCPPCPICLEKYSLILGLFGIEISQYFQYLLPVMVLFLIFTLFVLARNSYNFHHRVLPIFGYVLSSVLILCNTFLDIDFLHYTGIIGLVGSVISDNIFMKNYKTSHKHEHHKCGEVCGHHPESKEASKSDPACT